MADFDSSLPIRSEADGADAKVIVKIGDGSVGGTFQATVDSDKNLHIESHGNDPAGTDRAILTSEEGHTSINGVYHATTNTDPSNMGMILHARAATPADADQTMRVTAATPSSDNVDPANVRAMDTSAFMYGWDGAAWDRVGATAGSLNVLVTNSASTPLNVKVDGVYDVATNADPDNVGLIAHIRGATPGDADQTIRLTGINSSTVWALDVAIRDENGAAFTTANPLPVVMLESEGTEINDYATGAAVAGGATSNHDYTVTALKTLQLTQIECSASGKMRIAVQVETGVGTGTYTTKFVKFNSTSDPNMSITLKEPISVAAGVKVRIARMNRDNQSQDVYSTISGHEV